MKTQEIICDCDTEKVRSSTPISIIWEFSNADKQKEEKIEIRKLKIFIVLLIKQILLLYIFLDGVFIYKTYTILREKNAFLNCFINFTIYNEHFSMQQLKPSC